MLKYVPAVDSVDAAEVPDTGDFGAVGEFVTDLRRAGIVTGYDVVNGDIRLRFHESYAQRARRVHPGDVVVVSGKRICVLTGDAFREAWKLAEGGEVNVTTTLSGNLDTGKD